MGSQREQPAQDCTEKHECFRKLPFVIGKTSSHTAA